MPFEVRRMVIAKRHLMFRTRRSPATLLMLTLLAIALACGPGQEPTPTPTAPPLVAATPTPIPTVGPVATATPTSTPAPAPSPTPQPKRGGVLELVDWWEVPYWDPQLNALIPHGKWMAPLYTNLFFNPEGSVIYCEICVDEQYTLENAGKTMVFTLQRGVKFHNGQEMTAADVEYSLEKMMGQVDGIVSPRCGVFKEYVDNIQAPSRYELRINLLRPSPFVPKVLSTAFCGIMPAGTTREQLQKGPFGSGPYLLKEFQPGASARYERNPNFFKPGLPYLDGMIIRKVADTQAMVVAFLAHRADLYEYVGKPAKTNYPQLSQLKAQGRALSRQAPAGCRPGGVFVMVVKPPFDNVKMRQAVNLAIDRKEWGKAILDNEYVPSMLFEPNLEFGRPESEIWDVVPGWGTGSKKQQEIEQGQKLLADAGYTTGIDLEQLSASGSVSDELTQAMLNKVGIRTKIKVIGIAELDRRRVNLEWSIQNYGFCQQTMDPDEMFGGYFITGAARNFSGWSNKEFDQLYVQMSSELDPVKRRQLTRQMEDVVVTREVLYAPVPGSWNEMFWYTYVKGFGGMGLAPWYGSGVHRKETVWLDQAAR